MLSHIERLRKLFLSAPKVDALASPRRMAPGPPLVLLSRLARPRAGSSGNKASAHRFIPLIICGERDVRGRNKRALRKDLLLAAVMVAAGTALSGFALSRLRTLTIRKLRRRRSRCSHLPHRRDKPAESKPGGTRPTTPAPEPARPDAKAQMQGETGAAARTGRKDGPADPRKVEPHPDPP